MTTNQIIQKLRQEGGMNNPDARYEVELIADALESLDARVIAVEKASHLPTPIEREIHVGEVEDVRGRAKGRKK